MMQAITSLYLMTAGKLTKEIRMVIFRLTVRSSQMESRHLEIKSMKQASNSDSMPRQERKPVLENQGAMGMKR